MISSGSVAWTRARSSLFLGSRTARASSSRSRRSSASRVLASGPWQVKQLSERIGRMSSLKLSSARVLEQVRKRVKRSRGTEVTRFNSLNIVTQLMSVLLGNYHQ